MEELLLSIKKNLEVARRNPLSAATAAITAAEGMLAVMTDLNNRLAALEARNGR